MHTSLCDVLGIEAPVVCAPFGPWDCVDLAAAVCDAGGLGSLGTAVRPVADLRRQWERLRARTDRPFAINHQPRPFDHQAFEATLAERPAVISYHMGDPGELVARAHDAGCLWMQQVMDVDQARQAIDRGADILIAQGGEAGGHSGFIGTMVLVPQVVAVAGRRPVVAAGGITDGRGLAAALALGAAGVAIGTRFLASTEMTISPQWKRMVVDAASRDAHHSELLDAVLPPFTRPHWPATARVLPTAFEHEWTGRPDELANRATELGPQIVDAILAGGGHEYVPFAGQSAGLVHDIRPAGDIIRDTVAEAEQVISTLTALTVGAPDGADVPRYRTTQPA